MMVNEYLLQKGYAPVEKDADMHDCYLCLLHFDRLEDLLGDVRGRRSAIIEGVSDSEGIGESTVRKWVQYIYGGRR